MLVNAKHLTSDSLSSFQHKSTRCHFLQGETEIDSAENSIFNGVDSDCAMQREAWCSHASPNSSITDPNTSKILELSVFLWIIDVWLKLHGAVLWFTLHNVIMSILAPATPKETINVENGWMDGVYLLAFKKMQRIMIIWSVFFSAQIIKLFLKKSQKTKFYIVAFQIT